LETAVLAAFTTDPPCHRKTNRPPGTDARAEAERLLNGVADRDVVVSLAAYQQIVEDLTRRADDPHDQLLNTVADGGDNDAEVAW
jgi:hypothetical protein